MVISKTSIEHRAHRDVHADALRTSPEHELFRVTSRLLMPELEPEHSPVYFIRSLASKAVTATFYLQKPSRMRVANGFHLGRVYS